VGGIDGGIDKGLDRGIEGSGNSDRKLKFKILE
jgi:hypothetical protein